MNQQVDVYQTIEMMEPHFNGALSVESMSWAKECGFAKQLLLGNKSLRDTATINQSSLQHAIVNVASIGISLNPASKRAYLVPRGGKVCLDVSYVGLMHLAIESGSILWGQSKLVYANDTYKNNGIDKEPAHEQQTFGDKGGIIGVYCTVKLPSGDYLTEEMDLDAINKIKITSKARVGPWEEWFGEMTRKSVVKRAAKYWPQSARVNQAVAVLNESEGVDFENQGKATNSDIDINAMNDEFARCATAEESATLFSYYGKIATDKRDKILFTEARTAHANKLNALNGGVANA